MDLIWKWILKVIHIFLKKDLVITIVHINLNYPRCTLVAAFNNGYIYTIETLKEPNEPKNMWFCIYKLDMSESVLDLDSDNFTEHLYVLIGKGYIGPDSYKNLS